MMVIGVNALFSNPLIFCILHPFDSFIAPPDGIESPAKRLRPDSVPDNTRATNRHAVFPHHSQLFRQFSWTGGWESHPGSEIEHLQGTLNLYHPKTFCWCFFQVIYLVYPKPKSNAGLKPACIDAPRTFRYSGCSVGMINVLDVSIISEVTK